MYDLIGHALGLGLIAAGTLIAFALVGGSVVGLVLSELVHRGGRRASSSGEATLELASVGG